MSFTESLSNIWSNIQYKLFPYLENDLGKLSPKYKDLIFLLEFVRFEKFIPCTRFNEGRPRRDRVAIARAFVAKIVLKLPYTKQLVERLLIDEKLRVICGWHSSRDVPSESKFSRAFKEFAKTFLPDQVHKALIKNLYKDRIIGHVVKDSAPIEVREKHLKKDSLKNRIKLKASKQKKKGPAS